ncbi:MAG TPA: thioredoxin family protein [Thermoflexales bacterium]|jgi:small redox-active disulfide protein 2|nr:thioredoxin family protein [Anaerolineae bacterium]HQX12485.1 thioredoxin family protein [Thermoflexales bacterium]HQY27093.1 thioredoxin family protein [Thermoflexales bacterium]
MTNVKILGAGCANCKRLEQSVRRVAEARHLDLTVEKVTDYAEMMKWNILQTPGLVVEDKLVSAGRIPKDDELARLLVPQA